MRTYEAATFHAYQLLATTMTSLATSMLINNNIGNNNIWERAGRLPFMLRVGVQQTKSHTIWCSTSSVWLSALKPGQTLTSGIVTHHDESTTAAKQKLNFGKEKVTIFRTGSPIIRHTANELGSLPKGSRTHPWLRGDTKPIRSLKFQTNTPNKRYDATTARTPSPQQRKWLIASVQNHRIVLTLVGQYIRWTANRD